jgi:hypothetical protein
VASIAGARRATAFYLRVDVHRAAVCVGRWAWREKWIAESRQIFFFEKTAKVLSILGVLHACPLTD